MSEDRFTAFAAILARVAKDIQYIENSRMAAYGLRSAHTLCLLQISRHAQGITPSALASCWGVDKALVSRTTGELMAGGFLCYEEDEKHEKKYKRRLLLTETGKHVAMEIREVIRQAANRVSGGLPEEDLAVFYRVFHRLADNIAALAEDPTWNADMQDAAQEGK